MKVKLKKEQQKQYDAWCAKHSIDSKTGKSKLKVKQVADNFPKFNPLVREKIAKTNSIKSVDSGIKGAITINTIMNPMKWAGESKEVIEQIKEKSLCIAPAFSKGAYQFITPETDPSDLGRKK